MANGNFGRLKQVKNIREHWPREDSDFTPWLATEDNIEILSEAIGIELEVQDQERRVGPFRADILCKNTADNTLVLIENQFGKTDHSHLGQLFTYAAGLDAVTLIWIVETFTDEHRAAIDWLNKISDDRYYFFAIEIELWTIGDSPPAPKFNVVSKPNDWTKTIRGATDTSKGNLSPWQESQIEYWQQFGDFIQENDIDFKAPKPAVTLWMAYGIGRSNTNMSIAFSQKDIMIYVQIDKIKRPGWFAELKNRKEEIEEEYGQELVWDDRDTLRNQRIMVTEKRDMTNKENWPETFTWFTTHMEKMKSIFKPRVLSLSENLVDEQ